jgi:hypothetical protein
VTAKERYRVVARSQRADHHIRALHGAGNSAASASISLNDAQSLLRLRQLSGISDENSDRMTGRQSAFHYDSTRSARCSEQRDSHVNRPFILRFRSVYGTSTTFPRTVCDSANRKAALASDNGNLAAMAGLIAPCVTKSSNCCKSC